VRKQARAACPPRPARLTRAPARAWQAGYTPPSSDTEGEEGDEESEGEGDEESEEGEGGSGDESEGGAGGAGGHPASIRLEGGSAGRQRIQSGGADGLDGWGAAPGCAAGMADAAARAGRRASEEDDPAEPDWAPRVRCPAGLSQRPSAPAPASRPCPLRAPCPTAAPPRGRGR
jgi:hypothetical protein